MINGGKNSPAACEGRWGTSCDYTGLLPGNFRSRGPVQGFRLHLRRRPGYHPRAVRWWQRMDSVGELDLRQQGLLTDTAFLFANVAEGGVAVEPEAVSLRCGRGSDPRYAWVIAGLLIPPAAAQPPPRGWEAARSSLVLKVPAKKQEQQFLAALCGADDTANYERINMGGES